MDRRSDDHMMGKSRALLRELASQIDKQELQLETHAREMLAHPGAKEPAAEHLACSLVLDELRHTHAVLADKDKQAKEVVRKRGELN